MEGLPAGLEPSAAGTPLFQGKPLWHLAFGMTPDVPERMLVDGERTFVEFLLRRGCYDPMTFPAEAIDAYTRPFAALGGVRGALAHIRAIPSSAPLKRKLSEKVLEMPVQLAHKNHLAYWGVCRVKQLNPGPSPLAGFAMTIVSRI